MLRHRHGRPTFGHNLLWFAIGAALILSPILYGLWRY